MQQAQTAPSSTAASFANLLASLTAPQPGATEHWDSSALAEDVATISYERALQSSARLKTADDNNPRRRSRGPATARSATNAFGGEGSPRSLIITLRVSHAESTQLHKRADEAGLTVSAYLRSCVFEVEALRTQVREVLSQFRSAPPASRQFARPPLASPTWRSRLFARWSRDARCA